MLFIVEGTIQALVDGIHNPPESESDLPMPAEYEGTLQVSIPLLDKTTQFAFALVHVGEEGVEFSIGKIGSVRESFTQVIPPSTKPTEFEIGIYLLLSRLLDEIGNLWEQAAAGGNFYAPLNISVEYRFEDAHLPLIKPIFERSLIQ